MQSDRLTRAWWPIVASASLLALALRVIGATESPAGDELYLYALIHNRSLGDMLTAVVNQEKTPPLGFSLAWLTSHIPPADMWMRAPAVIAGTALVPVTALLGRRTLGAKEGLAGAILVAVSPFLVFYGSEARAYSLTAALALSAVLCLLKACDEERVGFLVAFALLSTAAMLSHYTSIFVLAAAVIWCLLSFREARWKVLGSGLGAAALFALWLPSFKTQLGHAGDEARRIADTAPLAVSTLVKLLTRPPVSHPFLGFSQVPGTLALVIILSGFAVALLDALAGLISARRSTGSLPRPGRRMGLIVMLAIASPTGMILASLQPHRSLLLPRNIICSLPVFLLLVAAMVIRRPHQATRLICLGLISAGLLIGSIVELTDYSRPDMRSAADAISASWHQGDTILEAAYATGPPLDRDLAIHLSPEELGSLRLTHGSGLNPFEQSLKSGKPIFTVAPIVGYTTEPLGPPTQLRDRFTQVWSGRWPGLVDVAAVEWQPKVTR